MTTELVIGMKAPDFLLPTNTGREVTLQDFAGKKLILYFYPKDDTPGCTMEAKDFSGNLEKLAVAGCRVLGVSRDGIESHEKFAKKYCLPFSLASDISGKTCSDYGVWVKKSMYGKQYMGIERSTFFIDEQGIIRKIWRSVKVEGHVAEILKAIQY